MKTHTSLISRRETLRLIGATAIVGLSGGRIIELLPLRSRGASGTASALSCIVRPQQTEGPYFVDEKLNRSDIRTDPASGVARPGAALNLNFNVGRVSGNSCVPLAGAYVDIWHCDALGTYSDVSGAQGQKFLRGYQVTDTNGAASFTTIYPGWYTGRAVHIHFKIRLFTGSQTAYEFTSQLYFDDSLTDQVYTQSPYNTRGARDTRNARDGIYSSGGSQLLLAPMQTALGYAATFDISLDGVTVTPSAQPEILNAMVTGKSLYVSGDNFDSGAALLMGGVQQKKTGNDDLNPSTLLIARKSGKTISPGQTVELQVKNLDSTLSNLYSFTRPA